MSNEMIALKDQALKDYGKKRYQAAIEGFQRCLESFQANGDELSAAEMQNNLCVTLVKLKKGEEAFAIVKDTDKVFSAHGDQTKEAMALANTASALELLNRNEEALELYQHSLEIFKAAGEKEMRTSVLRRVADLQLKSKKGLQAMASMEAAYDQKDSASIKDSVFKTILAAIRKKTLK